jgi:hypothetical protein
MSCVRLRIHWSVTSTEYGADQLENTSVVLYIYWTQTIAENTASLLLCDVTEYAGMC